MEMGEGDGPGLNHFRKLLHLFPDPSWSGLQQQAIHMIDADAKAVAKEVKSELKSVHFPLLHLFDLKLAHPIHTLIIFQISIRLAQPTALEAL